MKRRQPLPRKTFFDLPPLELECMKALWAQGQASVKEIRAQINGSNGRGLAYTTIETIMDRLTRKGVVVRRKVGRAHLYTPQYQAAAARADAVGALVHHFFAGSRRSLAAYLAGERLPEPASAEASARRSAPRSFSPAAPAAGFRSLRESSAHGLPPVGAGKPVAARKTAPAPKAQPQPQRPARSIDTSLL